MLRLREYDVGGGAVKGASGKAKAKADLTEQIHVSSCAIEKAEVAASDHPLSLSRESRIGVEGRAMTPQKDKRLIRFHSQCVAMETNLPGRQFGRRMKEI